MKLVKHQIVEKDGSGFATLLPEEPEDMWHCFNLIRENDILKASAQRKVTTESSAGSTSSHRVQTKLTIRVTKLDFDSYSSQLHVSGRVCEENKYVKLGSYHTLDLELHRDFTLEKADGWDSIAIATLKESVDQVRKAQLWAVVLAEGMANICLVTDHQTILRHRVEVAMPKKRTGSSDHAKAMQRFFQRTFDTLLRQLDLNDLKPLLLASPAYTASDFQKFIKAKASDSSDKSLKALASKVVIAHSASGHVHDLAEVLNSKAVTKQLSDTKFSGETKLINDFFEMLRVDDARAWYGPKEVEAAVDQGAVGKGGGKLLISNSLFRSQDVKTRQRWVKLVDSVKEYRGEVFVLSSMHESGQRLEELSGIAVVMTYPIEEFDEQVAAETNGHEEEVTNGRNGHYEEEIDL